MSMSNKRSLSIFTPTNVRISARPYFSRWKRSTTAASRKYSDRSPMIAKMFDVKTMNGSVVTPKIAGNRVDREDQVGDLDENEDEQQRRREAAAVLDDEEVLASWYRGESGSTLPQSAHERLFSPSNSSSRRTAMRMPVMTSSAPKM